MDFIKGIPHKLIALEKLLLDHPSWASKIVLVQAHLGDYLGLWALYLGDNFGEYLGDNLGDNLGE